MNLACKALLLLTANCALLIAGATKTLTIPVPEGRDEITYDPNRIGLDGLRHLLTLSPVLSQNTNLLVPEGVWTCDFQDHAYTHCPAGTSIWLNPANAKHTQERIRNRLERLKHEQFPPDLTPIVDYFKAVQSFGLWLNQREISFYGSRNSADLEENYKNGAVTINPKVSCAVDLATVQKTTDVIAEWKAVIFQWHNCMWKQITASVGAYPQTVWDEGLKSRGIHEKLIVIE